MENTNNENIVYVLTEEFEDSMGIREFSILGVSHDISKVRDMMNMEVENDPTTKAIIKEKGIQYRYADGFSTNYEGVDNRYIQYSIITQILI